MTIEQELACDDDEDFEQGKHQKLFAVAAHSVAIGDGEERVVPFTLVDEGGSIGTRAPRCDGSALSFEGGVHAGVGIRDHLMIPDAMYTDGMQAVPVKLIDHHDAKIASNAPRRDWRRGGRKNIKN